MSAVVGVDQAAVERYPRDLGRERVVGAVSSPPRLVGPCNASGALSCAISTVPTPGTPPLPRSTLTPATPYVVECVDSAGGDVVNEVFIHRTGD